MDDSKETTLDETNRNLYTSGEYSDFTVTCGTDTYHLHKAIVCSRSEFFRRAERFDVGKEAAENKVDLPEDDPGLIKVLIQYLYENDYDPKLPPATTVAPVARVRPPELYLQQKSYHYDFPHTCSATCPSSRYGVCPHHDCKAITCTQQCIAFVCKQCCPDYKPSPKPVLGDDSQMLLHAQMYHIGDKYAVVGLKNLASTKFSRSCAKFWNTSSFPPAIRYALATTPEEDMGLRSVIAQVMHENIKAVSRPVAEAILHELSGLSREMLRLRLGLEA